MLRRCLVVGKIKSLGGLVIAVHMLSIGRIRGCGASKRFLRSNNALHMLCMFGRC